MSLIVFLILLSFPPIFARGCRIPCPMFAISPSFFLLFFANISNVFYLILSFFLPAISAGHASYFWRRVTASCCFFDESRVTAAFFVIFTASSPFGVTRHKLSALKTCFRIRFHIAGGQTRPSPPSGHIHPSPTSGQLTPILLAVKLSPLRQAVILHPCWRSYSPPSAQRSSSMPLLAVKFTHPRLTVILHPCWRSNDPFPHPAVIFQHSPPSGHIPPLPGQRSSSTPAGGQPHLSPPMQSYSTPPAQRSSSFPACSHSHLSPPMQRSYSTPPTGGQIHPSPR